MPNNCIFLVDTYNTIEGVKRAVETALELRKKGHEMVGVRLDSGDLAYLSIEARRILDEAGFPDAVIVASNDLDEYLIESLKDQGARVNVWGVGTKLATAYDQPALGGVYKLVAVRDPGGEWEYKIKLSEQTVKINVPGVQQVRRYRREGEFIGDCIYDALKGVPEECVIVDPKDPTRRKKIPKGTESRDLLSPVMRKGRLVAREEVRKRVTEELSAFHPGIKRLANPHEYPVGLEKGLSELRMRLILEARGFSP